MDNGASILPVDVPNVSENAIHKLSKAEPAETEDAVILQSGEDLQSLAGAYNTDLANPLGHYLKTQNRMVFEFLNSLNYSTIEVKADELINLNRPQDLNS